MGHERLGLLPKSRRWVDLVREIAVWGQGEGSTAALAEHTIRNVGARFARLSGDAGVVSTFQFLVVLSVCAGTEDPINQMAEKGLSLPEEPSLLSLVSALKRSVEPKAESLEYSALAVDSAAKALGRWVESHRRRERPLLGPEPEFLTAFRTASTGRGFCELAAGFFSSITEGYLNYFLERSASAELGSIARRDEFSASIHEHAHSVAAHALETARITKSFAAGWFNRHAGERVPTEEEVRRFLHVAFGKLREELQREAPV
jgi:hypothetical protein